MPTRRHQPRGPSDPQTVADRLHSGAIRLLRRLRLADDASGLSAPRLSALSVVVHAAPISIGALATAEQVRAPTISRLVKGLEAAGLVTRARDPRDERIQLVRPTARGRRVLEQGRQRRVAQLAAEIADLPPAERAALARAAPILLALGRPAVSGRSPR